MVLTPQERGKIYADHAFLEGIYDSLIESNAVGSRVVDINPREVFLKRLRPDGDSPDLPIPYNEIKDYRPLERGYGRINAIADSVVAKSLARFDFLDPKTWGALQPYTLLNELESEYGEILGYLRKIGKDDYWLDQTRFIGEKLLIGLYNTEVGFLRYLQNRPDDEFGSLRTLVEWVGVEFADKLPIKISRVGLSSPSSRLAKKIAKLVKLAPSWELGYANRSFFRKSLVFGQADPDSNWNTRYWNSRFGDSLEGIRVDGNRQLVDEIIKEIADRTRSELSFVKSCFQNLRFDFRGGQQHREHQRVLLGQAFEAFLEELYQKRIEEAYKKALAYFDEVQREVLELAKMHVEAKRKAAQEEARKKRQAEEKARKEKAKKEAEKIAKEEQRKKQIVDEKERDRLALIREKQFGLLRKCKTTNMASGFCSLLENKLLNSEFICSWEDLLHRVWVPLGRPKNSEDWNVGIEWVLTSFSWSKSVEDLQKHIEHTMSTVVNPLISDQSVLLGLLPNDVKTFGRVVSILEEKEFFNLQPEFFVGLITRPEQEFQHLKRVMIQLFDSSQDISSVDRILGRLLADEDEAYVLADEGVAFQT